MAFDPALRTTILLWCDRHCCVCKKACGVNIEVDHIVPQAQGGTDDIDNALPVCFDCHAAIKNYDPKHPRGTKYKQDELRARREQVYEEFTRHLVPTVNYKITQQLLKALGSVEFPEVRFEITHAGDYPPVKVIVTVHFVLRDAENKNVLECEGGWSRQPGYYNGNKVWNLNPRLTINGWFVVPPKFRPSAPEMELEVVVSTTVVDPYKRPHHLLPIGFVFVPDNQSWYVEPGPSFSPTLPRLKDVLEIIEA
jgi:hypothetical protein